METRTNIVLDDELVARAMAKAGVSTKKAAIEAALRAYVRSPDWQALLALSGSGVLADDYDPRQMFASGAGVRHVAAPAAPCLDEGDTAAAKALKLSARPTTRRRTGV